MPHHFMWHGNDEESVLAVLHISGSLYWLITMTPVRRKLEVLGALAAVLAPAIDIGSFRRDRKVCVRPNCGSSSCRHEIYKKAMLCHQCSPRRHWAVNRFISVEVFPTIILDFHKVGCAGQAVDELLRRVVPAHVADRLQELQAPLPLCPGMPPKVGLLRAFSFACCFEWDLLVSTGADALSFVATGCRRAACSSS